MPRPPMPRQLQFRKISEKLPAAEIELGHNETDLAAVVISALAHVFGA
jgi:hypothetical protein